MADIATVSDGLWSDMTTWDGGAVPTSADTAVIRHKVTVNASVTVGAAVIDGGSLTVAETYNYSSTPLTFTASSMTYNRRFNDTGIVRLDGVVLHINPSVSSVGTYNADGFPGTGTLAQNADRDIIVSDGGYFTTVATLQDNKTEGCGHSYTIKRSNNVRSHIVEVRVRASMLGYVGEIIRMAESPFQVLAVTDTCLIKGFVETVVPVANDNGKEYVAMRLTITEGQ